MLSNQSTMRATPTDQWTYHDRVFANDINEAIIITDQHYSNMLFREALRVGFYDLQVNITLLLLLLLLLLFIDIT